MTKEIPICADRSCENLEHKHSWMTNIKRHDPKDTYEIVSHALRTHSKDVVRQIVYCNTEAVAMSNYINTRMFGDDIIDKLLNL